MQKKKQKIQPHQIILALIDLIDLNFNGSIKTKVGPTAGPIELDYMCYPLIENIYIYLYVCVYFSMHIT